MSPQKIGEEKGRMKDTQYVYALVDPATHIVRYVGRTRGLQARYRNHCLGNTNSTRAWVMSLPEKPVLVLLDTVTGCETSNHPQRAANDCETKWIKRFRRTILNTLLRDNSPKAWDALTNGE